jgi:hypothetical protein
VDDSFVPALNTADCELRVRSAESSQGIVLIESSDDLRYEGYVVVNFLRVQNKILMELMMPRSLNCKDEADGQSDGTLPTTADKTGNDDEQHQETGAAVKRVREVDDLTQDNNVASGDGLDLNPS